MRRHIPPAQGDIRVSADVRAGHVVFRVRDSGEGIAADELPRIFGLFTRAGRRGEGGFGSEGPGRGSEFRITLPAYDPTEATVRQKTA